MAKSGKIQIKEELRTEEANRMLSIARRKMETGELLSQHDFPLESAQMYQQAMELSVKAMMIVVAGGFYTKHNFPPRIVEETLRVCRENWPNLFHFGMFLERCFETANRWSLKRELLTYGYVYGSSGELLMSADDAVLVKTDAERCVLLADIVVEDYEEQGSK